MHFHNNRTCSVHLGATRADLKQQEIWQSWLKSVVIFETVANVRSALGCIIVIRQDPTIFQNVVNSLKYRPVWENKQQSHKGYNNLESRCVVWHFALKWMSAYWCFQEKKKKYLQLFCSSGFFFVVVEYSLFLVSLCTHTIYIYIYKTVMTFVWEFLNKPNRNMRELFLNWQIKASLWSRLRAQSGWPSPARNDHVCWISSEKILQ